MSVHPVLALCVGACLGAVLRWRLGLWLNQPHALLPWGTLLVNALGGLLIGLALGWFEHHSPSPALRLFLITGLLGALTTFSSFSAEILHMLEQAQLLLAACTALAHVAGSLILTWLGLNMARKIAVLF